VVEPRTNNCQWPIFAVKEFFSRADRAKLRALGSPLPGPGPFKLFRGVAGRGPYRRERGIAWTGDYTTAAWFAQRTDLPDPTVLSVVVEASAIYAHLEDRKEDEYLVDLPARAKLTRCDLLSKDEVIRLRGNKFETDEDMEKSRAEFRAARDAEEKAIVALGGVKMPHYFQDPDFQKEEAAIMQAANDAEP
jgi:hypothetical protein